MAKTDLDELIEHYQMEKNNLEQLIKEDLADTNYKAAHLHSKALRITLRKLRLLGNLNDPDYRQKESLNHFKRFYESSLQKENDGFMLNYQKKSLAKVNYDLELLNEKPKLYVEDTQHIDDAIYDLIEGKIRSFKLNLNQQLGIYILFALSLNGFIKISLAPLEILKIDNYNYKNQFRSLKSLGFKHNKEEGLLYYDYPLNQFADSIYLKTLLSRIIFDIFYSIDIDTPTTLELH